MVEFHWGEALKKTSKTIILKQRKKKYKGLTDISI